MRVGVALAAVVSLPLGDLLLLLLLCGWSSECWLVAIWEDASAIGVKVCVSQDRAPTHVAGGWYIQFITARDTLHSHHPVLQREFKQLLRELALFTARAVCSLDRLAGAAHFCARQGLHHFWGDSFFHFAQTSALPPSHTQRHSSHPAARDSRRVGHFTSILMA